VSQDAVVCGSVERLKVLTGFVPRIPLRETIGDVLEYQRRQVGAAPTR
jgi:hypothetical protein